VIRLEETTKVDKPKLMNKIIEGDNEMEYVANGDRNVT
jgi:hypothetical protein